MYKKATTILSILFFAALGVSYTIWLFTSGISTVAAGVISLSVTIMIGFTGSNAICNVFASWKGEAEIDIASDLGKRSLRAGFRHPVARLFLALLLARLFVYAAAYALNVLLNGYNGSLFDTIGLWLKGDAPHYLGIADNWYVTEGDARFHIVFFPLYPIIVSIFKYIMGGTFASGLFVSVACTIGAGILLYELALLDLDRAAAKRAVKFQMLLPAAFLLNAPMSDGLFLLLSIACILYARKKDYLLACLFGGLASFTRVLGVILVVPVFIEIIGDVARQKVENQSPVMFTLSRIASILIIPMGFLAYLMVNRQVTGNAFTFLDYQSSHWNQRLGWFFNSAAYQTDYFFNNVNSDPRTGLGLWLPNLIFLVGAPVIILLAQKAKKPPGHDLLTPRYHLKEPTEQPYRLRASYEAYFLAYYIVGMGATWLLSAPRYLTCCFPLSIALASIVKNRVLLMSMYALLFALQIFYMAAYVGGWPVY